MSIPSPKICRRVRDLFRSMDPSNLKGATAAHEKLLEALAKHGLTWNDIPDCVAAADEDDRVKKARRQSSSQPHGSPAPSADPLEIILHLIERHVAITPEERMLAALWVLHAHVFDRFDVTPRLALLSPVRGCGKTTLLILLELLTADPHRSDNTTGAAIYYLLDRQPHTLLVDEGDNLGLLNNSVLRSVFNSGHRRGGGISRYVSGRSRKFPTFAPLAVAAIGEMPLPLLHRSIIINMQRSPTPMARLDERDPVFPATRAEIAKWAAVCKLNPEPDMPASLRNRAADNCRVLFAIADDLGYGEAARAAATTLFANRLDEDIGVVALTDIRSAFDARGIDRITSKALIEALLALDDGLWTDWRGPNDDRPPRKFNQSDLARLLRPFGTRPRTIRFGQRSTDTARGYLRAQFESAWAAYCPPSDTPTQSSKVIHLPRAQSDT
jgi:hypothetical protein